MIKILGLTGGIGSGKTTVAKMFEALGVPVYNADQSAKMLMQSSQDLKDKIKQLLGEDAYTENRLNKAESACRFQTRIPNGNKFLIA